MNLVIIGYGGTGSRIADTLVKLERKYHNHVPSLTIAVDTAAESLADIDRIDESHQLLIGQSRLEGRGAAGDLDTATSVVKRSASTVLQAIKHNISRHETDAFLVIGNLGGATGGAGAAVTARDLAYRYDDIPIYTAGVLPALDEPATFTANAARTIQSVAQYSDNTILFDNEYLGATLPEYDATTDTELSHYEAFKDVNATIARGLYITFSADTAPGDTTLDTDDIIDTLNTGGLSTIGYARQELPMPARPGVTGWIAETASYMTTLFQSNHQSTPDTVADADTPERTTDTHRDWPHPTDFVPDTLHPDTLMLDADPRYANRTMHVLLGPGRYLTADNPSHVRRWIRDNTTASHTAAGNYAVKTSHVGTIALYSDIGVPERITQLQTVTANAEDYWEQEAGIDSRDRNVFDDVDTSVSPAID